MTLRVLILTDYPLSPDHAYGGISRSLFSTMNAIRTLAPDIEFHICTLNHEIMKSCVKTFDNLIVHYIRFPFVNVPILVPKQLTEYLIQKKIREIRPDLIHAQGTNKDYGYPAIRYDMHPTLLTVHGVVHEESKHWEGVKGRYHAITGKRMERFLLGHATHVVAVSPYVKRVISPYTKADITVIFNPVDPKFFEVEKSEVQNRLLFIGGIEERKGLETLIQAIYRIKEDNADLELHIVGGVRNIRYYRKIQRLVCDLDLGDQVLFLTGLSDDALMKEYAEAAVFVLPSKEESQGIVLLEAMATGTPVVASDAGGMPDVIEDGRNGYLVACGDFSAMAVKISALLGDRQKRQDFGSAGREMATQYLPKMIAEQHLTLYRRLLEQRRPIDR